MPSTNDEFDLDDEITGGAGFQEIPGAQDSEVKTPDDQTPPDAELLSEIDPEDDRENWPTIHIDSEEGKPNYAYLAAYGTKKDGESFGHELQVMRGVNVKVPPSIVYGLRDAISAHYVQTTDITTGKKGLKRQDRSAMPWQLVDPGKHVKPPRAS